MSLVLEAGVKVSFSNEILNNKIFLHPDFNENDIVRKDLRKLFTFTID
jgi:exoribonuclease R